MAPKRSSVHSIVVSELTKLYPLRIGLVDIAVNLADPMFRGRYHGKRVHTQDLHLVIERAAAMGVSAMIITGGNFKESREAIELAMQLNKEGATRSLEAWDCPQPRLKFYATVGCHPTHCKVMNGDIQSYLNKLRDLLKKHSIKNCSPGSEKEDEGVVVAIGEFGLDYDRLFFTEKEDQLTGFKAQFALVEEFQLPLFLHSRNTGTDFSDCLKQHENIWKKYGGVVHSFTGTQKELDELLNLGLYIGINGCSLKTEKNVEIMKGVPLDKLMLETDAPWCSVKKTHASHPLMRVAHLIMPEDIYGVNKKEKFVMGQCVRDRCEPMNIVDVFEVVFQTRKGEIMNEKEMNTNDEKEVREILAKKVLENIKKIFHI